MMSYLKRKVSSEREREREREREKKGEIIGGRLPCGFICVCNLSSVLFPHGTNEDERK